MSWSPNDLCSDDDLEIYEQNILDQFGRTDWMGKRSVALEHWLFPVLRGAGFNPERIRTRYETSATYGYTASAYTNYTSASISQTADDLPLATIFATPGTDALYVGFDKHFLGLSIRMLAGVSAVAGTLTVQYWNDAWTTQAIVNGTLKAAGKPFSGGGAVTWELQPDWVKRQINGSAFLYWVKVSVSATPTAGTSCQLGVIRRSVLSAPVTLRTLALIMREAPTGGPGPWADKALYYETEADAALQRALGLVASEIDTDQNDLLSPTEEAQTGTEVGGTGGGWRMERY